MPSVVILCILFVIFHYYDSHMQTFSHFSCVCALSCMCAWGDLNFKC